MVVGQGLVLQCSFRSTDDCIDQSLSTENEVKNAKLGMSYDYSQERNKVDSVLATHRRSLCTCVNIKRMEDVIATNKYACTMILYCMWICRALSLASIASINSLHPSFGVTTSDILLQLGPCVFALQMVGQLSLC